ncbi:MAG: hypothetical protein QXS81_05140 [Candidatus Micrarchaeaceae archaeon]
MTTISKTDPLWWTMYAIFAPIIVWPGQKENGKNLEKNIIEARLVKVANNDKSERATDAELAIYLSSASAIVPMDSDAANVYLNAAAKAFPQIKGVIKEIPPLTDEQKRIYDKLAAWIFKRQEEELNKKLRGENSENKSERLKS